METNEVSRNVGWEEVYARLRDAPPGKLYGIPRGGAIVAGLTGRAVGRIEDADWVVDDIIDSGTTVGIAETLGKPVWSLFDRDRDAVKDHQIRFPWEGPEPTNKNDRLADVCRDLLETLGYDPTSPELADTPERWASWWREFHNYEPGRIDTAFEVVSQDQLVVVSGIDLWSVCEHHLLPFSARVAIGYVPSGRLLGLSKFARIAQRAAHRLQLQERLSHDIANALEEHTGSSDIGVVVRGRHLCMEARGVGTPATTSTLVTRGRFKTEARLREDFLLLGTGFTQPQEA
jgi:GTP cyclohydrolase I